MTPTTLRPLLVVPILAFAGGCVVTIDDDGCRYTRHLEQVLAAPPGPVEVEVDARAGSLAIRGREGSTEIRVTGVACARRERDLDGIAIEARATGERAVIAAAFSKAASRRGARLDLTLEVPARATLRVDDGSGDVHIEEVASVRLDDGSGDIVLGRIRGDVAIDDDSGDVELAGVGAVRIEDGSGDITIRDAAAVTVTSDGSGDIEIREVAGDVVIGDHGSGDVDVTRVGGDLRVDEDDADDVTYAEIAGKVDIR